MNKSIQKTKVALGILFVGVIAGLIYNQMKPANQAPQGKEDKTTLTSTLLSTSKVLADSAQLTVTPPNTVNNSAQKNNAISSVESSTSSQNNTKVLANKHQLPADHHNAQQPKHHGHENQRRHPENNSLIPPGEPKKKLPEQKVN